MDFATLRSELQDLAGLDLTDPEAKRLLNEGHSELCVRSEWTRANVDLGVTAVGDPDYALPSNVHRILGLTVDDVPYEPGDVRTVWKLRHGDLALRTYGVWYLAFSPAGVETVAIYPTPTTAGLSIRATSIVYPTEMTTDLAQPAVPVDFHRSIVDYAASIAFAADEDNAELRVFYQEAFDRAVSRLRRIRLSRAGRGPVQMRVAGVSF